MKKRVLSIVLVLVMTIAFVLILLMAVAFVAGIIPM